MIRPQARRLALLPLLALIQLAALAPAAKATGPAFGLAPGSFLAKAHGPIAWRAEPPAYPIDVEAIAAAPSENQAGAHPDATVSFSLAEDPVATGTQPGRSVDNVKDAVVSLPPGFIGNPQVVPPCTRADFAGMFTLGATGFCPPSSQVGVATLALNTTTGDGLSEPVYRIETTPGTPASFGIAVRGIAGIVFSPHLRSDGDYGLSVESTDINAQPYGLRRATVTLWGVPANPIHDAERWQDAAAEQDRHWGASSAVAPLPFLSNPTYCDSGPLTTSIAIDSWQAPGQWLPTDPSDPGYSAPAPAPRSCEELRFGGAAAPVGLGFQPAVRAADTPSGYEARLTLPYAEEAGGLARPTLRDTAVTLPPGVVVNPAGANGLGACSPAQIGFLGAGFPLPNPLHFDEQPAACPDSSKLGTVEVRTPLLDHPLPGAIYLARQEDNPFGSLLAIYLAIEDPESGIVAKLAGRVEADPADGRLTAHFEDNPQLPFTELRLRFFGGAQAALVNPTTCGAKTTASLLTPWSAPYTPAVETSDSFEVERGAGGDPCPPGEAALPNQPGFEAGATLPLAGQYSPFQLQVSRADGSQRLRGLDITLPPGLTGRLAGIPYCSEAAVAQAESRTAPGDGARELADPSCPAASRVGAITVAAGAGPEPLRVQGQAYLAGPYRGAPLSLLVITPAVAGPFDLGVVAVRAALRVDPETAQVSAVSDPLPQILRGIPLDLRSLRVSLDRPQFTRNPSSCEPTALAGSVTGTESSAAVSSRFQVGACRALGFRPHLRLSLRGGTKRGQHPALTAVLSARSGDADIARAAVALPHSEFLEQSHIRTVCTRVQFNAGSGNGEQCPAGSVYGHARAFSPLLDRPLEGPAYLRSSSHQLPDLVVALHGQVDLDLVGRIDSVHGGIRTTFAAVPDAPVSKFVLKMAGGRRGLLVNSANLCAATRRATVKMSGHNGSVDDFRPPLRSRCRRAR